MAEYTTLPLSKDAYREITERISLPDGFFIKGSFKLSKIALSFYNISFFREDNEKIVMPEERD